MTEVKKRPLSAGAVRTALKAKFNYGNVKVDMGIGAGNGKVFKRYGVPIKAIPTGVSHSPVDVTTIGCDRAVAKFVEIVQFVSSLEGAEYAQGQKTCASVTFHRGTRDEFMVNLMLSRYPTHSPSQQLDSGYTTSWVDMTVYKD